MWIEQVMSGNIDSAVSRHDFNCLEILTKFFSLFCHGLVIVALGMFVLNVGTVETSARGKAKSFSGKSNISHSRRSARRSHSRRQQSNRVQTRRHQVSRHHSRRLQSRRHQSRQHVNNRQYYSGTSRPLRRNARKYGHHNRYAGNNNHGYRSSVFDVRRTLLNKRVGNTRLNRRVGNTRLNRRAGNTRLNRRVGNTRLLNRYPGQRNRYSNRIRNDGFGNFVTTGSGLAPQYDIDGIDVLDDPVSGSRIYYNARECDQGYDCVLRLGSDQSSPKIIVVGSRSDDPYDGKIRPPIVIYPPAN